jgi:putative transposase
MCRELRVSPSGYYAWRKRGLSRRRREDAALLERVRRIWEGSRPDVWGAPSVGGAAGLWGAVLRQAGGAADAGDGAGGGLPSDAAAEDHGAEPTGSRSFGPGGTAVPGGGSPSTVGGGSSAGPHEGEVAVPGVILDVRHRGVVGWTIRQDARAELVVYALDGPVEARRYPRGCGKSQGGVPSW